MKISIMDLMDHYYGEEGAALAASNRPSRKAHGPAPTPARSPLLRPLRIAAAFLLVVGITGALFWGFGAKKGMSSGNSLQQENVPEPGSVSTALSPEDSAAEDARTTHAPDAVLYPQLSETPDAANQAAVSAADYVLDCAADSTDYFSYGNLLLADGSYYNMTDNGPVPLDTTHLKTTVELYGTWTVDLDYAVVDRQLVFHNNTSTARYVLVDGEPMGEMDYYERYGTRPTDVIEPQVAVAEPVPNSADTVLLWIVRDDAQASGLRYPFFYNLFTGEVSDPLANVPELLHQTFFGGFTFNRARTRLLVTTSTALSVGTGDAIVPGSKVVYVCDLTTGTMTDVWTLLQSEIPEPKDPNTKLTMQGSCTWADDDTFLCWINSSTALDDGSSQFSASMYAYDLSTGQLVYQRATSGIPTQTSDFGQAWLYEISADDNPVPLQLLDTVSGTVYPTDSISPDLSILKLEDTVSLLTAEDGTVYLIDHQENAWVNLTQQLSLPKAGIQSYPLLTEDWLCLSTSQQVYCYRLTDIPLTPLDAA